MLRAARRFYTELEVIAASRHLRVRTHSVQTVLCASQKIDNVSGSGVAPSESGGSWEGKGGTGGSNGPGGGSGGTKKVAPLSAAVALATAAGGVYFYRKGSEAPEKTEEIKKEVKKPVEKVAVDVLPARVSVLVVGAGAAGATGARTTRALRPDATILLVGEEESFPYPRAPLNKQLWGDPVKLAGVRAAEAHALTYTRWDGRTRSLQFEPAAFYTPLDQLESSGGGVSVARGWRVDRVDQWKKVAHLRHLATGETKVVNYDQCLITAGARPIRHPALAPVRDSGLCSTLNTVGEVAGLARAATSGARAIALVGDTDRTMELAHSLATALSSANGGCRVVVVGAASIVTPADSLAAGPAQGSAHVQGALSGGGILPPYLAREATALLTKAGVTVMPDADVVKSEVTKDKRVRLHLESDGHSEVVEVDYVMESLGFEADRSLAEASDLAVGSGRDGAICVSPNYEVGNSIWAAGACCGVWCRRRRLAQTDCHEAALHAARLAAAHMHAGTGGSQPQPHHPLSWCDIGPTHGFEAVGVTDARLRTVAIFSDDAVADETANVTVAANATVAHIDNTSQEKPLASKVVKTSQLGKASTDNINDPQEKFKRGVVFYLEKKKIVGVLLWNLFNRSQIAKQVLLLDEVSDNDLIEIGKHFAPHEP